MKKKKKSAFTKKKNKPVITKAKIKQKPASKKVTVEKPMKRGKKAKNYVRKITKAARSGASYIKRKTSKIRSQKTDIKSVATMAGLGVAGAIIAAFVANKLPIKDKRIQAALPIVAGIGATLSSIGKNKILQPVLAGMIISGGVSMVRQFVPGLATMAGEDDDSELYEYMGALEDFSGTEEITDDYVSDSDSFGQELDDVDEYMGEESGSEVWINNTDI
jgi:hypothetical protein